mmetsp:Transcript_74955/g.208390  ORF Transcript_74955/g.208390 Transcript_74955/m.208390 type:complete len:269 (-) Transcript_74955:130-936(-)
MQGLTPLSPLARRPFLLLALGPLQSPQARRPSLSDAELGIVNLGCVQDWNANDRVANGFVNVLPSLDACKTQCAETENCAAGVYVTAGIRLGECWLADERRPLPQPCGAPCLAFEKVVPGTMPSAVAQGAPPLGADCDWNGNSEIAVGNMNFQPSVEDCQAVCAGVSGCASGVYVTSGPRRGECWLSDRKRSAPVPCGVACVPFEPGQQRIARLDEVGNELGSGVKGSWERCDARAGLSARVCLRLVGATLRPGGFEDTVLSIHEGLL